MKYFICTILFILISVNVQTEEPQKNGMLKILITGFKNNDGFENIKTLNPPLYSLPLFHFVNKKHEDLIPKITPIMARLLEEGLLEKLYEPYAQ